MPGVVYLSFVSFGTHSKFQFAGEIIVLKKDYEDIMNQIDYVIKIAWCEDISNDYSNRYLLKKIKTYKNIKGLENCQYYLGFLNENGYTSRQYWLDKRQSNN
jgi:hypothetical protein